MTTSDDELLALAEKATREPWKTFGVGDMYDITGYLKIGQWCANTEALRDEGMAYDDHEFIAACDPDTIKRLVRRSKRLEEAERRGLLPGSTELQPGES